MLSSERQITNDRFKCLEPPLAQLMAESIEANTPHAADVERCGVSGHDLGDQLRLALDEFDHELDVARQNRGRNGGVPEH